MSILHTSDWHLGQNFYGYDRSEEHHDFLVQIRDIVAQELPDAMVVSGDIFHNYTPSIEAQRLYTDSLIEIHNAAPKMEIFVTAGNHDSASRLEVNNELWRLANVHIVGSLRHNEEGKIDFSQHLFKVGDKGYVVALPYIFNQQYPTDPEGVDNRRYFFEQLNVFMEKNNVDGLPTVLMAHMAVRGSELKGQKIKGLTDIVGGIDFMPTEYFGKAFDYVALGHIHHPQTIHGTTKRVRYSGSPIAVSFDEDYEHSVTMVDVEHGVEPVINYNDFTIRNIRPLLTIPKEAQRTPLALDTLRKETPTEGKYYIRFNPQERHIFPASMVEDVVQALDNINPEAKYATYVPNITKSNTGNVQKVEFTPEQLSTMEPIDVAREFFSQIEEDFCDYEDLFKQVLERIDKEDAQ